MEEQYKRFENEESRSKVYKNEREVDSSHTRFEWVIQELKFIT